MRKIIAEMNMSLDGYFEGPNKEIDWFLWDKDMEKYAAAKFKKTDTVLLGRGVYELFAAYWTSPAAAQEDPLIAAYLNSVKKVVVSKTLDRVEWTNSVLLKGDLAEEIAKLKAQPGKDIVSFGGAGLISSLALLGLIDEFHVRINPFVLGRGHPLFKNFSEKLNLKLLGTHTFRSGVVMLQYKTAGAQ